MTTPYEKHKESGHKLTRYSPNSIDIIEECTTCGMRFLHKAGDSVPITMGYSAEFMLKLFGHIKKDA